MYFADDIIHQPIVAQGQDPPQSPLVDPNWEVLPTNLMLELIQGLQQTQGELVEAIK